ncbi:MAG TPA: hypothetical protein VGO59_05540 [Verrucomicrobiae bacterium]
MSLRIYQLWPMAVAGILGAAAARASAGYLPLDGPMPLRFRIAPPPPVFAEPPPPPPAHPFLLAPIELPSPPMPSPPAETNNVPPAKAVRPTPPAASATNAPAVEYDARDPLADSKPPAVPDGVVSPQMLIRFFTGPAPAPPNAGIAAPSGPVGFTPPAPSGKPVPATSP